jgi:hypothetical protein
MNYQHRIITALQTKGNVGKSFESILHADWLAAHSIPFHGFDLDEDHKTFSSAIEGVCLLEAGNDEERIFKLLRTYSARELTLIDPRAHMDQALRQVLLTNGLLAKAEGLRLTVKVFPVNEADVLMNLADLVNELGPNADYLIIENEFTAPDLSFFHRSGLEDMLLNLGARRICIPALYESIRGTITRLEGKAGRKLSFAEVLATDESTLDLLSRGTIEAWFHDIMAQYDAAAPILITTPQLQNFKPRFSKSETAPSPTARSYGSVMNLPD